MSYFLWPHGLQHASFPVPHHLPEFAQSHSVESVMPPNHLILCCPLSSCLSLSQHQGFFQWVCSLHQVAKVSELQSVSVLPMNIQGWFPLGWLVVSPCCPKDSPESSPAPQFEGINSSILSLLYGLTHTSIQNYWKNHSFDYRQSDITFYCQSDVSAFYYAV